MAILVEDQVGSDRFCIHPHVAGVGATVFRLVRKEVGQSYLTLELCEDPTKMTKLRIGRHLVTDYERAQFFDPQARFDGTLHLRVACRATDEGFIEPSGESRQA